MLCRDVGGMTDRHPLLTRHSEALDLFGDRVRTVRDDQWDLHALGPARALSPVTPSAVRKPPGTPRGTP